MKSAKKTATRDAENEASFEQAIQRLEKIVAEMESAELPLEDILKRYEEGSRLVRFCSQKLEEAEKKIELLTQKSDGSVSLRPFQSAEEAEDTASGEDKPEDKEARLF